MNILGITVVVIIGVIGLTDGADRICKVSGAKPFKMYYQFAEGEPKNNGALQFSPTGLLSTLFETPNNDCYMKVMALADPNRPDGCTRVNFPNGCNYITGMTVVIGDRSRKHLVEVVLNEEQIASLKVNGQEVAHVSQTVRDADSGPPIKVFRWGSSAPQIYIRRVGACPGQSVKFQYNWNQIMIKDRNDAGRADRVTGACAGQA